MVAPLNYQGNGLGRGLGIYNYKTVVNIELEPNDSDLTQNIYTTIMSYCVTARMR
jgi:hypothetical protein